MDSIIIQKYQPNNYEDVKRIFSLGMKEQISKGIKIGWKSPSVFGYLTSLFTFGYLFSFSHCSLILILAEQKIKTLKDVFLQFKNVLKGQSNYTRKNY